MFDSGITQPEDKGIVLKDIVHEYVDDKIDAHFYSVNPNRYSQFIDNKFKVIDDYNQNEKNDDKSCTLTTNCGASAFRNGQKFIIPLKEYIVPFDKTLKILNKEVDRGKVGYFRKDSQANRVYFIHGKAVTLCGEAGGGAAKMGQYLFGEIFCLREKRTEEGKKLRKKIKKETGKDGGSRKHTELTNRTDGKTNTLTTVLKDNYLFGCITPDRINKRQNGQRFNEGKKFYTLTAQDKHGIFIEGYIRKLTPIECERLQTLQFNKKHIKIDLCENHLKRFAQFVESKCPKLLKLALNAEKNKLKEYAQFMENIIVQNQVLIKSIVQKDANIQTQKLIKKCINHNPNEKNLNTEIVEKKRTCNFPIIKEDFAVQNIFINIIEGKITQIRKEDVPQKGKITLMQKNRKIPLKLYGEEITQFANAMEINLTTQKQHSAFTALFHLHQKSTEIMLAILYWFAKIATDEHTQMKIKKGNISFLFLLNDGYTAAVSDPSRYKMLGNGWTIDVIAHILKNMKL